MKWFASKNKKMMIFFNIRAYERRRRREAEHGGGGEGEVHVGKKKMI